MLLEEAQKALPRLELAGKDDGLEVNER